ncbi:MAG: MFS transporter [Rhizobiaceae bacterium]|nr:MFS transporter [Rhizobiaceae bacterium]
MTFFPSTAVRLAFGGMAAMAVAMGIGRFVFTPILPSMMDELGLSPAQAGWIASANYLGYLVGAFATMGAWAGGRERSMMLCGLGASTILTAAMGLSESLAAFLLIRFLAGVASAFVMVFLASIVFSHLDVARKTHLQAVHFAGVGIGISLSSVMMALIGAFRAPWMDGWFGAAILSALGLIFVAFTIREGPVRFAATYAPEPALPRDPALFRVIAAYGLFGVGYIVTATFLVAIVRESDAARSFEALVWFVTGIAIIPSTYLWSGFARRKGPATAYAACCVVEAIGVAASVWIGGWVGPVLAGILLGLTFVAMTAFGLQAARILAPQSPRRVLSLMTAWFGVGQIIGPVIAGLIAESTGSYFVASMLAAFVLLLSGAIVRPWSR